jgi:hypothetical protein
MNRQPVTTQESDGLPPELLSSNTTNFSLMLGGPLYQFFLRVGLVKPPLDRVGWRMLVISMFAWAPLLALAALGGRLVGGVKIPFLYDFEVHARFLAALPLLIGAEVIISRRIRAMLLQFVKRQVITSALVSRFEGITQSALRLRNSAGIELGLLVFVFTAGILWWRGILSLTRQVVRFY